VAELSHVDEAGDVRMVDVGAKPLSRRRARAAAVVRMRPETARRLRDLPKGDAIATARLAGIMGAKRTSELIPLCHPLPLSHIAVDVEIGAGRAEIVATVETVAQTGVEMEALTAVALAALTVYDMAKAIDTELVVEEVRLLEKTKEAP
jgi:cyclic pyranopterin monophosphate synthase